MSLSIIDWIVIGIYSCVVLSVGFYFSRKEKTSTDFFLGSRNAHWFIIGGSIFAANIGSEHLIGLAGAGAGSGLAIGMYELMAIPCLMILCWVFLPFYLNSKVFTMPEFLERRFNPSCRYTLSTISIFAYIFTKISVSLFAGAILIKAILGWPIMLSAVILVIIAGIYTIAGGLSAVIFNNTIEAIILIAGTAILTFLGMNQVGGFEGLNEKLGAEYFDMIKPMTDPGFPWTGTFFGILILGTWYWCTDQVIVQRCLAAKNLSHARGATLFTAFLKIFPLFLFVLPGLIAKALWPTEVSGDSADMAFPTIVVKLMPKGMAGLMIAALLAALTSSLSSVFNSCSTLITMDFYKKLKPEAPEKKLVFIGRLSTGIIIALSIIWIPMISQLSNQMYLYMQSIQAYIGAPISAVFIVGILWKKATGKAAITTMITGGILGILRFLMDILRSSFDVKLSSLGPLQILTGDGEGHFMFAFLNYCIVVFVICVVVMVTVSLITSKSVKSEAQISGITFSIKKMATSDNKAWTLIEAALSILVLLITATIIAHFA